MEAGLIHVTSHVALVPTTTTNLQATVDRMVELPILFIQSIPLAV